MGVASSRLLLSLVLYFDNIHTDFEKTNIEFIHEGEKLFKCEIVFMINQPGNDKG